MTINGNILKFVIPIASGLLIGSLSFMGTGIVSNDVRNTEQHIEIRQEAMEDRKDTREQVERVDDKVDKMMVIQTEAVTILRSMNK